MPAPVRRALPFSITVTVRRSGGVDRYGDRRPATSFTVPGCISWPRVASETSNYDQATATGLMLAVPDGVDLRSTDEVLLPGEDPQAPWWAVDGQPLAWGPSPFTGRRPGLVVALERRTG